LRKSASAAASSKATGLTLEIVYTQGSGETLQAVISESVDIGVAVGIMGALSAYSRGAPIRIIGAETTGAGDLYWYVKTDSPIKTLKIPTARPWHFPPRAPPPMESSPRSSRNMVLKQNQPRPAGRRLRSRKSCRAG
jgi:hypothetical protein